MRLQHDDDDNEDTLREETRALAGEVGPELERTSLTDLCGKCGRELGEHDGKKCPPKAKKKPAKSPLTDVEEAALARSAAAPADPGRFDPLVPRATIRRSPTNPRKTFSQAKLEELAESIRTHGIINPIVVRPAPLALGTGKKAGTVDPATLELVAGERRWRAAEIAALELVPCIIRELTDVQVLEIQIIENVQRDDVHPLEEADGYRDLLDKHGYTVDRIVEKTGKSKATVYARLKLCDLGPEGRKSFLEEGMHAEVALAIARIPAALQEQAVKAVMGRGTWQEYNGSGIGLAEIHGEDGRKVEPMSVRQAREYIRKRFMLRLELAKFDITDATLTKAGACTGCTMRTGNQPELFADVQSADVCTNPTCFDEKTQAGFKVAAARAKADGIEVLAGKKAEGIIGHTGRLTYEAQQKYFDPKDEVPYELSPNIERKSPTWQKLVGKELDKVPKVIVQAPDGGARELYDREAATKLLRETGKVPKPSQARARSRGGGVSEDTKRRKQLEQRRLVVKNGLAELAVKAPAMYVEGVGPKAKPFWEWLAIAVTRQLNHEDQAVVSARRGLEVEKSKSHRSGGESALIKHAKTLNVAELRGLVVELLAAAMAVGGYYTTSLGQQFNDACKAFGVDTAKLTDKVKAEAKDKKGLRKKGITGDQSPIVVEMLKKHPKNKILVDHLKAWKRQAKTTIDVFKIDGVFWIREQPHPSGKGVGWHEVDDHGLTSNPRDEAPAGAPPAAKKGAQKK